jgi:tetratricopeptide (TPR) repeat protein
MIEARQAYWADQARIQSEVIEAWVAHTEGRTEEAVQRLRAAADHEDATEKNVVTPGPLAPARESLGEMLMEVARPGDALVEFEAVTVKEPNRFRALYGAARAAELSGDPDKAREYYNTLMSVAANPDGGRPEFTTAQAFLGR